MNHLWRLKRAFMKDLIECYSDPRPASTTLATLLKRMTDKGYVNYKTKGRSREYFPLVDKKTYFGRHIKGMISQFFNGNASQFASYFASDKSLTQEQLKELKEYIDSQIKKD